MNQHDLLRMVIEALESRGIQYMLVGSYASAVFGEGRSTHDIDIVVRLSPAEAERLCNAFPAGEFYVSRPAALEAVRRGGQFNVIHPASGNKIDFLLARDDAWGRSQFARRVRRPLLPGCEAYIAAPEDVILGKLWYFHEGGSDKHLRDIAAMLQISGEEIDRAYIDRWAAQLGVEEPWQAALRRLAEK